MKKATDHLNASGKPGVLYRVSISLFRMPTGMENRNSKNCIFAFNTTKDFENKRIICTFIIKFTGGE